MPRPRRDGTKAAPPNKRRLSEVLLRRLRPDAERAYAVWDVLKPGLAVVVQPSGHKAWKFVYTSGRGPRWYHIGNVDAVGLGDARRLASELAFRVAKGEDPLAERKAERGRGTFAELHQRYLDEYAKKHNKSWRQADALVRKHLLPRWGKLQAADVARADVRAMMARIEAPITANQTLAAASAIFSWAIRQEILSANPCQLVERNQTKSRERVLSDGELPQFWAAFDAAGLVKSAALRMILLTGQRPGEVACMRREHLKDGWWEMPGDQVPELGWPGTKNAMSHRVWLPARSGT